MAIYSQFTVLVGVSTIGYNTITLIGLLVISIILTLLVPKMHAGRWRETILITIQTIASTQSR